MLGIDGKLLSQPAETQILTVVLQNLEKSAVKYFIEKSMSLNRLDLSTIFYARL